MLNAIITIVLIISGPISIILFFAKWMETDFDTAFETFEKFVADILK